MGHFGRGFQFNSYYVPQVICAMFFLAYSGGIGLVALEQEMRNTVKLNQIEPEKGSRVGLKREAAEHIAKEKGQRLLDCRHAYAEEIGVDTVRQEDLARALDVTPPSYSRWEQGIHPIPTMALDLLQVTHRFSKRYILEGKGPKVLPPSSGSLPSLTQQGKKVQNLQVLAAPLETGMEPLIPGGALLIVEGPMPPVAERICLAQIGTQFFVGEALADRNSRWALYRSQDNKPGTRGFFQPVPLPHDAPCYLIHGVVIPINQPAKKA